MAMKTGNELIRARVLSLIQEEAAINPRGASRRVARKIGVADSVISDIKRGTRSRMKPANLEAAAAAYGRPVTWFYEDDNATPMGPDPSRQTRDTKSPRSPGGRHDVTPGIEARLLEQIATLQQNVRAAQRTITDLTRRIRNAHNALGDPGEQLAPAVRRRSRTGARH